MRAIHISRRHHAEFVDVPKPTPPLGHALIRPTTLSLCGSDVWMLKYAAEADYPLPAGTSGHEVIGIVEELNGEHPELAVGDRTLTIAPEQAAMAEYYVAPFKNMLPVPAGVSSEQLVQAQQIGTVMYACKQLPSVIGKNVVVIGQGSAGLWFNWMLKRLGAHAIIAIDQLDHRLVISKQLGATHTINNSAEDPTAAVQRILNGQLADIVVEAVGTADTVNLAIALTKMYGFLLQFGVPHAKQMTLNVEEMFNKNLTLRPVVYASLEPDHLSTRMALKWIASGELDVTPVITHRFPFDRVPEAYELQHTRTDGAIKIIIDMLASQ